MAANDVTPINLDVTVERIAAAGGRCKGYVFDVAMKMPVQALIEQVREDWGSLDILVNNAGVEPHASILEMDEWDWRRTIDVNLSGAFFTIQSAARVMQQQGGGVIVNIASIAGRAHGLRAARRVCRQQDRLDRADTRGCRELAAYNIRVNAVCPGVIETEMTATLRQDEAMLRKWLEDIPQRSPGAPRGCRRSGALPVQRRRLLPHRSSHQRGRRKGHVLSV